MRASYRTFADRATAGGELADLVVRHLAGTPEAPRAGRPLVLGLPRGGLPIAAAVAGAVGGDLDVLIVRKIGSPRHPEFGVGAIAEDGPAEFDHDALDYLGLTPADLAVIVKRERAELRRRARRYRGERPAPPVAGRTVVLVDDGLATGVTARAAVRWLRARGPRWLILAIPVCSPQARDALAGDTDAVLYLEAPDPFWSVGQWYDSFEQLTDDDVDRCLTHRAH
ncbi:phosphoribosyltransferase family protein [Dactylosporangium sp. NPDC000555]|uniref:phosphoribosyltransferase n=1 Tax=Dactylosporangium sp. NPDC000555 TaxID=3154260 RepID=UPI0033270220